MESLRGEKIFIGTSTFAALDTLPLERLCRTGCEILNNPFKRKLTKPELLAELAGGVTGIIAGLEPLDREVLENSKLKVISRCGSGVANIDLKAAKDLNIKVYTTPDAPIEAVAELTLGAMLGLLRMVPEMDGHMHRGEWVKKTGTQLKGKTVAIIGFGRIGRRVAALLAPFDVRIIAVDPNICEGTALPEVLPLNEALKAADIITIHAKGKKEIIGKEEFAFIKKGSFLLNAARGGVVDEDSLVFALDEGRIKGAWLDTFLKEPYEGPLRKYPQVMLTPHAGSYTLECRKSMEMQAVSNLILGFKEHK